jgi:dihydroorotate dehydrogenase
VDSDPTVNALNAVVEDIPSGTVTITYVCNPQPGNPRNTVVIVPEKKTVVILGFNKKP